LIEQKIAKPDEILGILAKDENASKTIKTDKHNIGRLMLIKSLLENFGGHLNETSWK
jgi:hypothetical protein